MNDHSRQPASQKTHRTLNLLGGLFTVIVIGVATVAFTTRDKSPETTTTGTPTVASPTTSNQLSTADTSSLTTISSYPDSPDTMIDQIDSAPPSSETTSSVAKDLSGKVVVLDPGHNGGNSAHSAEINRQVPAGGFMKACDTSGTQTYGGYPEHAFTYDVSNRAAAALRERGATVYLTRDNDTGVGPCVDVRAASGGTFSADIALSIHADGGPDGGRGFHILPPTGCSGCMNQIVEPSAQFAAILRDAFRDGTPMPTATYAGVNGINPRSDLAGINLSTVPKVFIECGNMRNSQDAALLADPTFRQAAAVAIANGILNFLTP